MIVLCTGRIYLLCLYFLISVNVCFVLSLHCFLCSFVIFSLLLLQDQGALTIGRCRDNLPLKAPPKIHEEMLLEISRLMVLDIFRLMEREKITK